MAPKEKLLDSFCRVVMKTDSLPHHSPLVVFVIACVPLWTLHTRFTFLKFLDVTELFIWYFAEQCIFSNVTRWHLFLLILKCLWLYIHTWVHHGSRKRNLGYIYDISHQLSANYVALLSETSYSEKRNEGELFVWQLAEPLNTCKAYASLVR